MKIGVTGGSGFIGSHVVDKLIYEGHKVVVLDREEPSFIDSTLIEYRYLDITDEESCKKALTNLDAVYHLAAMANANQAYEFPNKAYDLNVAGSANVAKSCVLNKVKYLIYASTEWVYSALEKPSQIVEVDESSSLDSIKMNHIYSVTKHLGEVIIQKLTANSQTKVTILRFGIPYGPRAWKGTVFYNFLNNALEGKNISIKGTGNQFRRFVFVEDLAEGCAKVLNSTQYLENNEVINLTGDSNTTIKELAELVVEMYKNNIEIEYTSARNEDFGGVIANNNKAKDLINWYPKTSIADGLKSYNDWLINNRIKVEVN